MTSYFEEHDCTPLAEGAAPNELLQFARFLVDSGNWDQEAFSGIFADRPPPPTSKKFIDCLPSRFLSCSSEEGVQCPICLKEPEKGDTLLELPCDHEFHSECVKAWLGKAANCPLCRYELPTDDPEWEEMKKQKKRKLAREQDLKALHNGMFG